MHSLRRINAVKKLAGLLISALVDCRSLRERLAFELVHRHFRSLDIKIPLSGGLVVPVTSQEAWVSFSEIFLQGEYDELWSCMPVPDCWLDLGCHSGYFSLLCEEKRRREGRTIAPKALLVDADSRSVAAVEHLIIVNKLDQGMHFMHGAVGPAQETVNFVTRSFMSSGVAGLDENGGTLSSISVLKQKSILEQFPPPYDLIKIDIEGSEYGFVDRYEEIWRNARYLVFECHETDSVAPSWEEGARWVEKRTQFERLGARVAKLCDPKRSAGLAFFRNPAA